MEEVRDKVRGAMLGGAIGDALGYPIEFQRGIRAREVTHLSEKGLFSDDTQMTLFTACGLLWRETRWTLRGIAMDPVGAVYLSYLDWLGTQQKVAEHTSVAWIKNIPELNVVRDPGMTCLEALESGKAGKITEPINESKGCGGIMRVAPVGLFMRESGRIAAETCAITHGHPLAILSAFVFAETIAWIVNDGEEIQKAVENSVEIMMNWKIEKKVYEDRDDYTKTKFRKVNPFPKEKKQLAEIIQQAVSLAKSDIEDQAAIRKLGEGWVAEEALAIAIFSTVRHSDSFEDAVICAVNHDGDSDSTGAIAGNIIGAKLGFKKIPDHFKNNIQLKDLILELADDMTMGVPTDKNGNIVDERWLEKYLLIP